MQKLNGRPCVFLDTDVLLAYLHGEAPSSLLFSKEIIGKVYFAVNPVVLQELLFLTEIEKHPEVINTIEQQITLLPLNLDQALDYLQQVKQLGNQFAHTNDVLILSSAKDCDYLVTYDNTLKDAISTLGNDKPEVLSPEQLISELKGKV